MTKKATKTQSDSGIVTFTFGHGETLTCDPSILGANVVTWLVGHGISQKVGDSYSGSKDSYEAEQMARDTWDQLKAGILARKRSGGGASATIPDRIYHAIVAEMKGREVADVAAIWEGLDRGQRAKVKAQVGAEAAKRWAEELAARAQESDGDALDVF